MPKVEEIREKQNILGEINFRKHLLFPDNMLLRCPAPKCNFNDH